MDIPPEAAMAAEPLAPLPPRLGVVEVQKAEDSRTWYVGHILDVSGNGKSVSVGFDCNVWEKADFPISRVRKPPKAADNFNPAVGEEVELRISATDLAPAFWSVAVVKQIKHTFFFMTRVGLSLLPDSADHIVERDALRPVHKGSTLEPALLRHEVYKLGPQIQAWAASDDGVGCLAHIESQSGLTTIRIGKDSLKLYGEAKQLELARKLLDVHAVHQAKITSFQEKREKQLRALETIKNRIEGAGYEHTAELRIKSDYIRRVIGKGGQAIKEVEEKYNVNVRILDDEDHDAPEKTVRLFAHSLESLEKARAEVEYVEEVLAVEPDQYQWVLGSQGKTINSFKDLSGVVKVRLEREESQLRLAGTRTSVTDAVAMFETHMMYYGVYNQMNEEMEKLILTLEKYGDYDARWEWKWAQQQDDYEEDYYYPKSRGKGKSPRAPAKSSSNGQSWSRGGGKSWYEEEEEAEQEPSASTAARPPRKREGKKGGKGGEGQEDAAETWPKSGKGRAKQGSAWDTENGGGKSWSKKESAWDGESGVSGGKSKSKKGKPAWEDEDAAPGAGKSRSKKGSPAWEDEGAASGKSRSKKGSPAWEDEDAASGAGKSRSKKGGSAYDDDAGDSGGGKSKSKKASAWNDENGASGGKSRGGRSSASSEKENSGDAAAAAAAEEPEPETSEGGGRGRGGRRARPSRGRGQTSAAAASAEADEATPVEKPAPPPASASARRMGKKGLRS